MAMTGNEADLKLVLLGDKNVGKTTLFNRYLYGEVLKTQMTIGAYFSNKSFTIEGEQYEVNVWDTAGEEKFNSLTKFYTRGAHAAIVVYDITVHDSWTAVENWCDDLDDTTVIIIAGNKLDLVSSKQKERQIGFEEVEKFARQRNALAIEGSGKTGHNVSEMFQKVMEECIRRNDTMNASKGGKSGNKSKSDRVKLDSKNKKQKDDDGCCLII